MPTSWIADNPPPSLQQLVRTFGTYNAIPADAWADYDLAMADWYRRLRGRHLDQKLTAFRDARQEREEAERRRDERWAERLRPLTQEEYQPEPKVIPVEALRLPGAFRVHWARIPPKKR